VGKLADSAASVEIGAVLLGKYRIEKLIGRGGMGIVVKARHLGLDNPVAIKLLRDDVLIDDETITRFVREAKAAGRLRSEHVAQVTDVGTFPDGKPFMVMDFLEGEDLGQLIKEQGRINPQLAVDLVIQACDGLAEAHSLNIVHRDVKPTNLFVTWRSDGTPLVKVLDFGISKSLSSADLSLTQTQSMLGTPAYMSPEQMRSARTVDARTDIWSLGAVLYEALEGHMPFVAESFSEMCVKVAMDPPDPMEIRELEQIVGRCLHKQPDQRYATIAELARDLVPYSRDPVQASHYAERMARLLSRGSGDGTARFPRPATPPAGIQVQRDSRPSMTPAAAAAPLTLARSQARRRRPWVLPAVGGVAICAGIAVGIVLAGRGDAPPKRDLPVDRITQPTSLTGSAATPRPGEGEAMGRAGSGAVGPPVAVNAGSPTGVGDGSATAAGAGSATAAGGAAAGSAAAEHPAAGSGSLPATSTDAATLAVKKGNPVPTKLIPGKGTAQTVRKPHDVAAHPTGRDLGKPEIKPETRPEVGKTGDPKGVVAPCKSDPFNSRVGDCK
jgi:serine/threonine-protein kinase